MVDSEETLDFLEQRVSMLESLVFGQAEKDADYPKVDCNFLVLNSCC